MGDLAGERDKPGQMKTCHFVRSMLRLPVVLDRSPQPAAVA